jgi:hypothetical protein
MLRWVRLTDIALILGLKRFGSESSMLLWE